MSRKLLLISLQCVAFVSFFLNGTGVYAQDFANNEELLLKLELGTEKMIYRVMQPIEITVYLRNLGEKTLEVVEPAIDKRSFFFEITQPDGKKNKLLAIYGLNLQKINLPPKKRLKFTASFTPEMSGTYNIEARYYGYQDKTIISSLFKVFVVNPPPVK